MGWMKASSPKATSLIASGKYRRRWWGDAYRKRKRRGCWLTSNNALGPMASAYQSSCRVRYQIGSALPLIRSPHRRAGSAEVDEDHRADGGREFLFLVADIPDADYFARCVLDRIITGHVRFAEDVDFAVESLTFVDIHYRFSLRVQDGPKRPAVYAAGHIGGYADIIVTRLYEKRSRAAGLSLDLVDNREVVVHLGCAKIQPWGRLIGCLIGSLDLGRAQFRRLGLQYRHGLRDFWVRLRVPRTRHQRGRCDEAAGGQETNKKALAIHVSGLLYERRSWNEGTAGLRSQAGEQKHDDPRSPWKEWLLLDFKQYRDLFIWAKDLFFEANGPTSQSITARPLRYAAPCGS